MKATYGLLVKGNTPTSKHVDLYSSTRESEEAKAERILRKFIRHVKVLHGSNTVFLFPARHIDVAIENVLIGFRALEYVHVKAQIVLTAP